MILHINSLHALDNPIATLLFQCRHRQGEVPSSLVVIDQPLQLTLPTELGCGFIILDTVQSCYQFITVGKTTHLPSLIVEQLLFHS